MSIKLAYLVTHPIQYQAPMLRRIANEPGIDLHVIFMSDFSVRNYYDVGFGAEIKWDVPLTEGYSHEFLPQKGPATTDVMKIRNVGLRHAISARRFDALWSHGYAHRVSLSALALARARGIKTMVRADSQPYGVQRVGIKGLLKDRLLRYPLKLADAFLTVGTLNHDYYAMHGVPDEKMFLVPYAIENGRFREQAIQAGKTQHELRADLGLEENRPVILYASKLVSRKKVLDLFHAFRTLLDRKGRRPYLVVVGDGEDRPELERAVADAGLERDVRLTGFKNQTELPRYFDLCDVFVLPAAREPWALVVNEVMCASRPVIVSNEVGCGPDLVKEGVNGRIVKVGDVAALADAIWDVVADPVRCRAMGEKSWEIVQEFNFEADIVGLRKALHYLLPSKV